MYNVCVYFHIYSACLYNTIIMYPIEKETSCMIQCRVYIHTSKERFRTQIWCFQAHSDMVCMYVCIHDIVSYNLFLSLEYMSDHVLFVISFIILYVLHSGHNTDSKVLQYMYVYMTVCMCTYQNA